MFLSNFLEDQLCQNMFMMRTSDHFSRVWHVLTVVCLLWWCHGASTITFLPVVLNNRQCFDHLFYKQHIVSWWHFIPFGTKIFTHSWLGNHVKLSVKPCQLLVDIGSERKNFIFCFLLSMSLQEHLRIASRKISLEYSEIPLPISKILFQEYCWDSLKLSLQSLQTVVDPLVPTSFWIRFVVHE